MIYSALHIFLVSILKEAALQRVFVSILSFILLLLSSSNVDYHLPPSSHCLVQRSHSIRKKKRNQRRQPRVKSQAHRKKITITGNLFHKKYIIYIILFVKSRSVSSVYYHHHHWVCIIILAGAFVHLSSVYACVCWSVYAGVFYTPFLNNCSIGTVQIGRNKSNRQSSETSVLNTRPHPLTHTQSQLVRFVIRRHNIEPKYIKKRNRLSKFVSFLPLPMILVDVRWRRPTSSEISNHGDYSDGVLS